MSISPKTKRNISRVIPFGIIWLVCAWVFLFIEMSVTRFQNLNPDTDITLTLPVFIFANTAIMLIGLIIGGIEMVYLEKKFRSHSFKSKIGYKFFIYFILFLLVILICYPIATSLETGTKLSEPETWKKLGRFLTSLTFLNTLFQLSISLLVSLIYAAISENLGHQVFLNLFTGKYHKPIVETRIFMFLDMKSSTAIAESLGHVRYFQLMQEYYDLMSDPIINCSGEVYQYIGDEIVTSWKLEKGIENANCIRCFVEIQKALDVKNTHFKSTYGFELGFKAGLHYGEVAIGEIGALKKEIVFTGDVLNTTARIQDKCNELGADLLVSSALKSALPENPFKFESKGLIELKGKGQQEELYSVEG